MSTSEIANIGEILSSIRPDFIGNVAYLESSSANGIRTPEGFKAHQFRAGIEVEFTLLDPASFREELEYGGHTPESLKAKIAELQNPDGVNGEARTIVPGEIEAYRAQARAMVSELPATGGAEEARRQEWLNQIDDFSLGDFVNMKLYGEFSKPTLKDNKPPEGTLQELDDFTEEQGWLEFRFGTAQLQEGYYDNGVFEYRLAPCSPSEALHRRKIIMSRLVEIADEYGLLVQSGPKTEHLNLSVYEQVGDDNTYRPVIGTSGDRQAKTLNVLAGISAGFEDGMALHPSKMHQRHLFVRDAGDVLGIGSTRKPLRVIDDRLELGAKFEDLEQAMDWLVAGAIYGIQEGVDAISGRGYTVPHVVPGLRVHRTKEFSKTTEDVAMQRAFENVAYDGGSFSLNRGWNLVKGRSLTPAILGRSPRTGYQEVNDLVISATRLDDQGMPFVDREALARSYHETLDEAERSRVTVALESDGLHELADRADAAFRAIRLKPASAIEGQIPFSVSDRDDAYERIERSPVAALATRGEPEQLTSWLRLAA